MGEAAQRKGPAYSLTLGLCCYLPTKWAYGPYRALSIDYGPYRWWLVSSEGLTFLGANSHTGEGPAGYPCKCLTSVLRYLTAAQ